MSKGGFPGGQVFQDWAPVQINRRPERATGTAEQQRNKAQQQGQAISTEKKYGGGANVSIRPGSGANTKKLDEDTETLKSKEVSADVRRAITQGRTAKGWNQKEFARTINEQPRVVQDYEQGKAIPNQQILGKMERALQVKLRGKDIGQPLQRPQSGGTGAAAKPKGKGKR